jgi:hypothetical protein
MNCQFLDKKLKVEKCRRPEGVVEFRNPRTRWGRGSKEGKFALCGRLSWMSDGPINWYSNTSTKIQTSKGCNSSIKPKIILKIMLH